MKVLVIFLFTVLLYFNVSGENPRSTNILLPEDLKTHTIACRTAYYATAIFHNLVRSDPKIYFYLITKDNRNRVLFEQVNGRYKNLHLNIRKRTAFIVHGFLSNGKEKWVEDLANAYLDWEDSNVIIVDWGDYAENKDYFHVVKRTPIVGREIAIFLRDIIEGVSLPTNTTNFFGPLHLMGHSLGAHTIGIAASHMRKLELPWLPTRLTGFDPAQQCFEVVDVAYRLDRGDADLVDVIHTNAKSIWRGGFGKKEAIGHFDFYPNGGRNQPGCKTNITLSRRQLSLVEGSLPVIDRNGKEIAKVYQNKRTVVVETPDNICSHGASYNYFLKSLRHTNDPNCVFKAFRWVRDTTRFTAAHLDNVCRNETCVEMGINAEKYNETFFGSYYSVTEAPAPYCISPKEDLIDVKPEPLPIELEPFYFDLQHNTIPENITIEGILSMSCGIIYDAEIEEESNTTTTTSDTDLTGKPEDRPMKCKKGSLVSDPIIKDDGNLSKPKDEDIKYIDENECITL